MIPLLLVAIGLAVLVVALAVLATALWYRTIELRVSVAWRDETIVALREREARAIAGWRSAIEAWDVSRKARQTALGLRKPFEQVEGEA